MSSLNVPLTPRAGKRGEKEEFGLESFNQLAVSLLLPGSSLAFLSPVPPTAGAEAQEVSRSACWASSSRHEESWGRQDVLSSGAVAAATGALLTLGFGALPAGAESTLASRKVQFFRYAPRIKSGVDFYQGDFKKAVDSKDWATIQAAFAKEANAPSTSLRNNPKKFESRFDKELFGPMKIFAQTIGGQSSQKLTTLLEAEEKLETAVMRIGKVATGDLKPVTKEEGGFFAGLFGGGEKVVDPYEGKNQAQIAQAAWKDGKEAYNTYMTVVNKALTSEVNKLPLID